MVSAVVVTVVSRLPFSRVSEKEFGVREVDQGERYDFTCEGTQS